MIENREICARLGRELIEDALAARARLDENGLPPEIEQLSYEGEYLLFQDELKNQSEEE